MVRVTLILGLVAIAWCSVASAAGLMANGDFETGLTGWEVKAEAGASVSVAADKPAAGKGALALQSNGKTSAWALSPELTDAQPGQPLLVTFSVRRVQLPATPASVLLLDLVGSLAEVGEAGIWEGAVPADTNWHKLSLLLKLPPLAGGARVHLAFGVVGGAGAWQVDEVSVQPGTLPVFASADQSGEKPVTARLESGWVPEGTLDATSKTVGADQELIANVNGVELGILPQFACYRGYREGMMIYAVNRGDMDKTVRAELAGPDYVDSPAWDVPVKRNGTTTFRLAVQSLRQGECWVKLTFTSAGQSVSVPVKIICKPSYPTLGGWWQDAVDPGLLQAAAQLPLDMQVLCAAPAAALSPMTQAVQAAGLEYVLAPAGDGLAGAQYLATVSPLLGQLHPTFWLPYCGTDPTQAFLAAPGLAGVLRKQQLGGGVFTPPLDLARDAAKNRLLPVKSTLLTSDRTSGLLSLTCRLPRLRPACVLSEQVDGKGDVPGGAAAAQLWQSDLSGLRALANERQVNLPLLVDHLRGAPGGDERLDALGLAKALVNCLYQGSTGVTLGVAPAAGEAFVALPAQDRQGAARPVASVVRLVQQELASATPLVPLLNSADISASGDTPVTYKPFLRGGEGIVVLWNNTSVAKDVTLEFRSQPVVSHRVTLSYSGEFVTSRWEPIMKFPEESFKRGIPSLFLHLEPQQVQFCGFRLLDPHVAWLRNVAFTVPYVAPPKDAPADRRDARGWWTDLLKGRDEGTLGQ